MSRFRLKAFPPEITACDYVSLLDLSGNTIETLPYDICSLVNLRCAAYYSDDRRGVALLLPIELK